MISRKEMTPPRSLLERHRSFWNRGSCERALVRVETAPVRIDFPPVQCVYGEEAGKVIGPDQADAARFLSCVQWDAVTPPGEADLFDVLPPYVRIPWLEAIAGCRVIPHPVSDSIWSYEPDIPLHEPRRIEPNLGWLDALIGQVERLNADDTLLCPTGQTVLRGPGDVAEAMLGAETLCLAMADEADWVVDFIGACTDLFIRSAQAQLERIKPIWGGYFNFFGFWSPEPCVRVQEDVQAILSPAQYRKYLRPALERIVSAFPYSMFHIHSGSLKMVEEVISVPGLTGLEVAIDEPPYAPPICEQIPILRRIQEEKPLFIEGQMSPEEIAFLTRKLKPEGLAIRSACWVRDRK
ncbi:MAG: hypothetical protein V1800_03590 [Candidatus Latescibacterota bacterium]